jgi:hypothetical protein
MRKCADFDDHLKVYLVDFIRIIIKFEKMNLRPNFGIAFYL